MSKIDGRFELIPVPRESSSSAISRAKVQVKQQRLNEVSAPDVQQAFPSQNGTPPAEWRLPISWWHELPEAIIQRLGTETLGPQRAIIEEGQMLLSLHRLPQHKGSRQGVYFWMHTDDDWKVYREDEPYDANADGEQGLSQHLQEYVESVEELNQAVIRARTAAAYLRLSQVVAIQKHAAENLFDALREARVGMVKPGEMSQESLGSAPDQIPYDPILINFRDRAYGIKRDFELLYEDTRNAIEYREASQAEWLNLLIAIFFPLTIAASIVETGVLNAVFERSAELDPLITILCLIVGSLLIGLGLQLVVSARRR